MLERGGESLFVEKNVWFSNCSIQTEDVLLFAKCIEPTNPIGVISIAQCVLSKVHFQWKKLATYSESELQLFFGLSALHAQRIAVLLAVSNRLKVEENNHITHISSPSNVYEIMKPYLSFLDHEEFYAIYLDNSKKIIGKSCISKGGITATIADGRIIFKKALLLQATGIILCHNHPSGNKKESKADVLLTKNLIEFGKFIDVVIVDHLIFTDNGYLSFLEEGLI